MTDEKLNEIKNILHDQWDSLKIIQEHILVLKKDLLLLTSNVKDLRKTVTGSEDICQ